MVAGAVKIPVTNSHSNSPAAVAAEALIVIAVAEAFIVKMLE